MSQLIVVWPIGRATLRASEGLNRFPHQTAVSGPPDGDHIGHGESQRHAETGSSRSSSTANAVTSSTWASFMMISRNSSFQCVGVTWSHES
jgi:hypothetical protein